MATQGVNKAPGSEPCAPPEPKSQGAKPKVFIISDIRLYREGLSMSLAQQGALEVLGASRSSVLTLDRLEREAPDALILDIQMPDGLQLARDLHDRWPDMKIVAFGVADIDGETITGAMAGISGYVHRDAGIGDLVTEVLNSVRGELHCSPQLAARLVQQIATLSLAKSKPASSCAAVGQAARVLTRRETEILALVDKGLSNKEIARALDISFATVKNHVHHILDKLHVRRRAQALARLREQTAHPTPSFE